MLANREQFYLMLFAELRHNLENEVREREANEQALLDERKRLEEEVGRDR